MNLEERYKKEIIPKMLTELKRKSLLSVPKLEKIVVNIGLKEALENSKAVEIVAKDLAVITGQKPIITKAKKAIAAFKLREGDKIGMKVTLRKKRMYDFLEKLIAIVLPRVRDFRGVSKDSFDKDGNYTLGLGEYLVFPEVDTGKIDKIRGLEITLVIKAKAKEEAKRLLELMGMPFKK